MAINVLTKRAQGKHARYAEREKRRAKPQYTLRNNAISNKMQFLLYNMPDAEGKVQVVIKDETLWCTQKAMAQLFGVGVPAISKHLKNIFEEGELVTDSVISKP